MSSRCRLARLIASLVVGVKVVEHDASQASFEAAQCLCLRGAGISALSVVRPSDPVEADLGDGDAVQGGVELAVARTSHPDSAGGVS